MSVSIAILLEGYSEKALFPALRTFLETRLAGQMPRLKAEPRHGRIPTGEILAREVKLLLKGFNAVIALTDVYTGKSDVFTDAADAKQKMKDWVGNEPRFYPHAAQHDFEAWLLPYWPRVQELTGSTRNSPSGNPETVNHGKPPSYYLAEAFRTGTKSRKKYVKPRDAGRILRGQNLAESAKLCPEFKAFLNTILQLSGGELL